MPDASNLLKNIVDVVCVVDTNTVFQYVSEASISLWGYRPEEMIGRPFTDFILPEDVQKTLDARSLAKNNAQTHHFENRYRHKDGSVVFVSWSAKRNPEDGMLYCVGRDGSGQRALEHRLLKAQEIAGVANFEYDIRSKRFIYISENIYNITGLSPETNPITAINDIWDLLHPDDLHIKAEFAFAYPTVSKRQHQYRIVRPDGRVVYLHHNRELIFDAQGNHIQTIGTFQDVTAQKLSELALIRSEKRFRTLVQGGSDILGILNANGEYTYIADSFVHILGYSSEDLVGKHVTYLIHPDDLQELQAYLEQAVRQKYLQLKPLRFHNSKGEWRWIKAKVNNFLDDPDICGLVFNSVDVTEQKIIDDRVRQLSIIAQESMHAIIMSDRKHRITWVNKTFLAMSEYTMEELIGKRPLEVFGLMGLSEQEIQSVQGKLERGEIVQTEVLSTSKSGRKYWSYINIQPVYNEEGKLVQYVSLGKDITERIKAQEALALSEQRFRALVQKGSDLIVILDKKGCFTYISDSVQQCLGYTSEELLGKNMSGYIHPDDLKETIEGMQRVMDGEARYGIHHRFLAKDGRYVWLESKGQSHFENSLIGGMIINSRDITDRVELQKRLDIALLTKQKEITSAVIKAQESERSKLGLELHDNVNQVLTTIKLYLEMYLSGYREDRALLERSTQYLQESIDEIRSISKRLSAPTLGKIALHDSIGDLVESINLSNRLKVTFEHKNLEHLPISEDLHLSIYRIVQESINNTIKYAGASKTEIFLEHAEGVLKLVIRDNSKGFNSNERWQGIGITNMKTRAENMNGQFHLDTALGKGCTITAYFPVAGVKMATKKLRVAKKKEESI